MPDMRSGAGPRRYTPSPSRGSYSRSRSRTPSYSDSFESEEEKSPSRKMKQPIKKTVSKRPGGKKGTQKGRVSPRMLDVVARRMLSAKRVKVNDLRNEVDILNRNIEELRKENKTLQNQARLQERALNKVEGNNAELPTLLQRHNEELRAVKEQLRRYKDRYDESQKRNKELDTNLARVTRHLTKLKELTEDKNLKEREVLSRRVNQLEDDIEERDRKLLDLERYLENLQKNHRHELSIEVHRHKDTQKRLSVIENQLALTESNLKEKEKILEIQNIYTQRVHRAPHHINNSTGSTPLHFRPPRKLKTGGSAEVGLTPREKARVYEERRRNEEQRKALFQADTEPLTSNSSDEDRQPKRPIEAPNMRHITEAEHDDANDQNHKESLSDNESSSSRDRLDRERQEADDREREEQQRREQEIRDAEAAVREKERLRLLAEEEEEERRRAAREKEEEERRLREEEEAADRRRKEFAELQKREAEERKRKDALLSKLKALDAAEVSKEEEKTPPKESKEDDFIASLSAAPKAPERSPAPVYSAPKHQISDDEESVPELPTLDLATGLQNSGRQAKPPPAPPRQPQPPAAPEPQPQRKFSNTSSSSSKKQYSFKDQVENMHAGRPAYNDVTVPYIERKKRSSIISTTDDEPFGAGRRGSLKKNAPLFGASSRDSSPLGVRRGSQQPATALPWEIEDSGAGDRMLPRRPSQQNRSIYPQRVSPIAVSDDIEELTL